MSYIWMYVFVRIYSQTTVFFTLRAWITKKNMIETTYNIGDSLPLQSPERQMSKKKMHFKWYDPGECVRWALDSMKLNRMLLAWKLGNGNSSSSLEYSVREWDCDLLSALRTSNDHRCSFVQEKLRRGQHKSICTLPMMEAGRILWATEDCVLYTEVV